LFDLPKQLGLFTLLDGIRGYPEHVGALISCGEHNSKDAWEDERMQDAEFENSNPDVLIDQCYNEQCDTPNLFWSIVGAGHNGLELAARLKARNIFSYNRQGELTGR
jgi:hypothetical protein